MYYVIWNGWMHHDDVTTFQIDVTTRIDDVTQHSQGNHGRLLSGRFIVNPNSQQEQVITIYS